ncbi:MAG: SurA N-terminal domain-containing protein, partial [Candidatus Cloacimonadaceae bacterium]|nr:SurA N-terminal domain-containing protein [Candidatus Cloacimonadaceae bacterium]
MKRISYLMLVIILLSLTACAVQRANLAGKVNGTNIDYTEFISAHRGHFNNFMTEKGRIPDTEEKKEILRQTWRNITVHVILKEHFKRYNIQVTQQEVIDTLINNVPDYLYSSPLLQVGGRFDRSLYIQSLEYDTPVNLRPVKQHYFDYLIPIQKLKLRLIDDILLSKRDIKSIRDILSSTANIDWIVFDPQDTQINISDSEIQSYYQSNLGLFEREQYFQLDYSLI